MIEERHLAILQDIYHKRKGNESVTISILEVEHGKDPYELRNLIEDLKEACYIVEFSDGFHITDEGINFCCRRWI